MSELREQLQSSIGTTYTLNRELGGGGMSRVFVAHEPALGREVVIKVLSPELAAGVSADRFTREVRLAARLQHANIVPLLSAGESGGLPWYTMPYVDGRSLRERLTGGPLPVPEVITILRDVARALGYAHSHGVVHRDIKPDNVLLSGGAAVVTDFGIAKALEGARAESRAASATAALTSLGTSLGTPAYMAPEQAAGDPDTDHRADIYSVGCMAYELLTGEAPFAGRSPQRTMAAHLTERVMPVTDRRTDTPPALAQLVMRCLEKDPADRPQSAEEIIQALDGVTSGGTAALPSVFTTAPRSLSRAVAVYFGAAIAVAIVAKAAVITIGLPDWAFDGVVALLVIGLPASILAAYGTHVARRSAVATPVLTPGGTPARPTPQGTVARLALRASPHLTWRRTVFGMAGLVGGFAVLVAGFMVLRALGIGPAGSLLASGKMKGQERLLIADVSAGKDSSLAHVVGEGVRTGLAQSSVVSLMPPAAVAAALQRMQRPANTAVDLALARDIAQREGVKAIVAAEVAQLGAGYVVSLRLVGADSGSELAAYRETIDGPKELLGAIDRLTRKLRGRIGESLKAVRDAPALEDVTTPSLEALRLYAEASRAADLNGDYVRAASLLREAVSRDTTFAMAYRKLGVALRNLGMPRAQVDSALTKAYRFRDRLTERERQLAIAQYFDSGPGLDRSKAAEAYERVLAIDPADPAATNNLGNILRGLRQFARAESLYRAGINAGRASQIAYNNLVITLLDEGKTAAAESIATRMRQLYPTAPGSQVAPALFFYQRGQIDSASRVYESLRSNANPVLHLSGLSGLLTLSELRGQLRLGKQYAAEGVAFNAARGASASPLSNAMSEIGTRIWFLDDRAGARRILDSIVAHTNLRALPLEQRPDAGMAIWYARVGQVERARTLLNQLMADAPDSNYRKLLEPARHSVMAEIAMGSGHPLDAIPEFRKSDSLSDGPANACTVCLDMSLAQAFDLANVPDSATKYYEAYLDTPYSSRLGVDAAYLAGAHKRLGEYYEAKGNTAKAVEHYERFVDLWKNADPELQPKVAEVRQRLTRLQAHQAR